MEELAPGTRIAGKYQLIRTIGRGGMGSVWEAVNESVGKRVAIKLLEPQLASEPEFMQRFAMEAQASAMIDHPDIVDVLDTGTTEWGAPFMVMEYLQGVTLRQLFKHLKRFTPGQSAAIIAPILDALEAAHQAGIVHRDLKPANIFLALKPRPSVKILDFGISKFQKSDGMTKTGVTLGTPAYMSPEQVRDSRTAGPTADIYSVGAMLYGLLSGHPPFEGDSDMAIVAKVLTDIAQPLQQAQPSLSGELCQLVDRCLSKDVRARPQSAYEVREALLALTQPDEAWVFNRVRELTPTESKPSVRIPQPATPSSRSHPSQATRPSQQSVLAPLPAELPAPKTITNSTRSERLEVPSGPSRTPVIVAGAVAVVIVGAAIAFAWASNRPEPQTQAPPPIAVIPVPAPPTRPPPVEVDPVAAPAVDQVELTLKAEPASAQWRLGEEPACNPCTVRRAPGTQLAARVEAAGFAGQDVQLTFDATRAVQVALAPEKADPRQGTRRPGGGKKRPPGALELDETNPYR